MNKDEKRFQTEKEVSNSDQNTEIEDSPIEESKKAESKEDRDPAEIESKTTDQENTEKSSQTESLQENEPINTEESEDGEAKPKEVAQKEDPKEKPVPTETEPDVIEETKPEKIEEVDKSANESEPVSEVESKTETESEADESDDSADESKPVASEKGEAEEVEAEADSESIAEEESTVESYYSDLAEKAESLLNLSDWAMASMEFDNIDHLWKEGPESEGLDLTALREKIDQHREQLEEKKKAHYELQKKIREENLGKKKDLLKEFKQIIDDEKWSHTRDVARIRNRWEKIKPIPAEETEKLEESFAAFLATFDEHKVDRLVKKKQEEEDNLTVKLVILEKMEAFIEGIDEKSEWESLDAKLSEFVRQFRKIGRIPSEKNQETWDRFYEAQDTFHSMRFKYDANYRKEIEKFLSKKKKLIDEAEALVDSDDLADAAREVNKLHRRWKKIGNLPQKDENEMWDRFKAATDAFNEKKSENIDELRDQEEENYNEKLKLIDKAIAIQDSEEWESTHSEYQKLMAEWKKTGPVPRKKSGKIWKKFKGAMDHFYDRRRDYFKEVKEERKDNLKEKDEIINQLKALGSHEDPVEAVELAKPLQEEFKKAGYVPIKHKNRLWKEYREACDVIYDRFRTAKSAGEIVGRENVDQFSDKDLSNIKKKQDQVNNLRKQISKQSSELIQMKESLSYFKPSKGGSSILDDAKKRIEASEKEIEAKEEQLNNLEVEIDKMKRTD